MGLRMKNPIFRGKAGKFADSRSRGWGGGEGRKRGVVVLRGWHPNAHYENWGKLSENFL